MAVRVMAVRSTEVGSTAGLGTEVVSEAVRDIALRGTAGPGYSITGHSGAWLQRYGAQRGLVTALRGTAGPDYSVTGHNGACYSVRRHSGTGLPRKGAQQGLVTALRGTAGLVTALQAQQGLITVLAVQLGLVTESESESEYLLSQYRFTRKFVLRCTVSDIINNNNLTRLQRLKIHETHNRLFSLH